MLEFLVHSAIGLIEKELVSHAPEVEEMVLDQLKKAADVLIQYVESKMMKASDAPVLASESPESAK